MNRAKAYQTELDDAYVALLVFDHPDLGAPMRFTDAGVDLTVAGNLYIYEPFKIQLPAESDDAPPVGKVVLDNVNQNTIAALRTLEGPLSVVVTIVFLSNPAVAERGPYEYEMRSVRWGVQAVEADLTFEPSYGEQVPTDIYSPAYFPGLAR